MTGEATKPDGAKPKKDNPIVKIYLLLFNAFSCVMWAIMLGKEVAHLAGGKSRETVHASIWDTLVIAQTLALLELVHSLIGIVRSPFGSSLMQVSSRILLTWGVSALIPEVKSSWGFMQMTLAWGLVEVPRYSFYAINLFGEVPYFLKWLRYSLFYVLYPMGISGELMTLWACLPYVLERNLLSVSMPNAYNFSFSYYYFLIAMMLGYIPGSPHLYGYMINARKKALGGASGAASQSKPAGKAQ